MWKCRNYSPEMRELRREVGEWCLKAREFGWEWGGMVSGSEEMKEADFVSASFRLASDAINSNLTRVLFAFRVTFSSFFVFRSSFSSCVFTLAGLRQRDRPI